MNYTRIYHHYLKWEDYKFGFYDNCSGEKKDEYIKKIIEMFNSSELTEKYMRKVIQEWKYSCEQNLTNNSINKIAYIGQAACCLYCGAPNTITMEAWSLLTKETQINADKIASKILKEWENRNKNLQLCLNLD